MRDISARELKGHNILAVERFWDNTRRTENSIIQRVLSHNILAVERFWDNTRWMIEFSVLRPSTAYGSRGDEMRLFLTERVFRRLLSSLGVKLL